MKIIQDKKNHSFQNEDASKSVVLRTGYEVDDIAALMIAVSLYPETIQGAYIEMLKIVAGRPSGWVPTKFENKEDGHWVKYDVV